MAAALMVFCCLFFSSQQLTRQPFACSWLPFGSHGRIPLRFIAGLQHAGAGPKLTVLHFRPRPMRERFILDHSIDELDAIAQAAVHRAVAALHAQGISTFFMKHGVLMEQAPDGMVRSVDEGKVLVPAKPGY